MTESERMKSRPTGWCRIGRHHWEGSDEHRRCRDCLRVELRSGSGKWRMRLQHNMAWCVCGNEMVGDPFTDCRVVDGGVARVQYLCRCHRKSTFDYGLAPALAVADLLAEDGAHVEFLVSAGRGEEQRVAAHGFDAHGARVEFIHPREYKRRMACHGTPAWCNGGCMRSGDGGNG